MPVPFSRMREFENKRVCMRFDDGLETVATLLSAVEDTDGSHHLIYDRVEWTNNPAEFFRAGESTVYAEGESLVSIDGAEIADAERGAQDPGFDEAPLTVLIAQVMGLANKVFGSHEQALSWLGQSNGDLDGQAPIRLMQTEAGAKIVESALRRIDESVYQ